MLLSAIVFLPLLGAVVTAFLPKGNAVAPRWVAAITTAIDLVLVGWLVAGFDVTKGMQFTENFDWVPQAGIRYHLAVDGISISMLALSALLTFLSVLVSWNVKDRPKGYFAMMLLLLVGMNGVFVALDFVLFYVFWELVLVPMFFMIGLWGGPRREYASIKFFLYTLFGSVFMLVGILALYLHNGANTFDMLELTKLGAAGAFAGSFGWWVFLAFFLGFAVKVPVWPFHTWLPDAHVEAPTAGSVLLAGILLKMGTYGFIRISLPMLPEAAKSFSYFIAVLAVISIIYGAAVSFAQTDLKKLVAYSSVSHMGFVMLGIAAGNVEGINGAVAVMFSHGVITGMLFMMVGIVYERTHTRTIADLSGLVAHVPVTGGIFAFTAIASLGLPGLAGFVGEFLSLLGAWKSAPRVPEYLTVLAAMGVLLAAAYLLWMVLRVVLGKPSETVLKISDVTPREVAYLAPMIALTIIVGVWWGSLLRYVDPAVKALISMTGAA